MKLKSYCYAFISIFLVLFLSSLIFFVDRKPILDGVEFSYSFSDSDGKLLKVFLTSDEKYRVFRDISSVPPEFVNVLLEQEDKRFFVHHGVNPFSVIRAAFSTYVMKSRVIGASTITMQTAKLRYGINSRTILGKLLQILYAIRLELNHSKQQILEAYLNMAPCGRNIEGFETASQYFFSKPLSETSIDEQILLCVLPQNPVKRCPTRYNFPNALEDAMKRLWRQLNEADENDGDRIKSSQIDFASSVYLSCEFPEKCLHFTRFLKNEIESENVKNRRIGTLRTSIDSRLQKILDRNIEVFTNTHSFQGMNNACAILVDSESMKVRAYTGSSGFFDDEILGQVDGNISKRSPGSTLKPFIYALAMEQGKIHSHTLLKDTPMAFSEYAPDNYGNDFKGPILAYEALIQSRNIPAVALARKIQNPDLYDFLMNAGISRLEEKDHYGLSIVLGSADLSPMELSRLYCLLLNEGELKELVFFEDEKGSSKIDKKKILTTESSFITRKMLEMNPSPKDRDNDAKWCNVGFKTGTSIGFKDAWTCGFFGKYVLIVWVGNFDGKGNNSFLGRSAASPLFFNIADEIISRGFVNRNDYSAFDLFNVTNSVPKNVKKVDVCAVSGCIPNEDCPTRTSAWFIPGVSPIEKCKIHRKVTEKGRTLVREFWSSDFLELFALAGLPRENPSSIKIDGKPPQILSPFANTQYVITKDGRDTLILRASADSDAGFLFWFSGKEFIAKSKPNDKIEWKPTKGVHEITVTDSQGRSSSRVVNVIFE